MDYETGNRWDQGLAGPVRRIAELDHTPMRVMAGPGTGKTFALMQRVARLLRDGTTASRIMVCTFTRTAARDLEGALRRLGVDGVDQVRASTLHAFCFGLLGRAEVLEATERVPRPLLNFEERFLLVDLNRDDFGGIRARKHRLQASNAAWARHQSEMPGWPIDPIDKSFHRELVDWLRFHKAMLIGELVPETLRYLRDNPASPHRVTFEHVLVDEYQDLNKAEQVLLDILSQAGNLTVIGDEDQSIYSFKYAHPEGIAKFKESHPSTHDEQLDKCRRCPRRVVEMANVLIANNVGRAARSCHPLSDNPEGEVQVLQWPTIKGEAQGLAEIIRTRIMNGEVEPGKVLVLAPRRYLGYAARDALKDLGINAHSFFAEEALDGDPKQFDKSNSQQALTLLMLLGNPEDRVALRCWCGFGSPSLQSSAWARLREYCKTSGDTPRTALERLAHGDLTIGRIGPLVQRFQKLQTRLAELGSVRGEALVDTLFPGDANWTSFVRSLASTIQGDEFDAQALSETLRIGITRPELPTDVDYVRVMSLHKSKGLTADLVVVLGCIEGLIPMLKDDTIAERTASLEEQRRLFYVAITRTRKILILSSVTRLPKKLAHQMAVKVRRGKGTYADTIASRFLSELGPTRPTAVLGTTVVQD